MDKMHTWSPLSNSGWLAQKHKFTPHDLPGVREAMYQDKCRLLTVYQKEYPKMDKRGAGIRRQKEPRQLIASKWQTPRTRDKHGNVKLIQDSNKEPTETERIMYSGRVPEHLLPKLSSGAHMNFGRGYISTVSGI